MTMTTSWHLFCIMIETTSGVGGEGKGEVDDCEEVKETWQVWKQIPQTNFNFQNFNSVILDKKNFHNYLTRNSLCFSDHSTLN